MRELGGPSELLSRSVQMASGGAQLSGGGDGTDVVGKRDAIEYCRTEVRGVQFAKAVFDDEQGFPDQCRGILDRLEARGGGRARRTAANGDSMTFVARRCLQCCCGNP